MVFSAGLRNVVTALDAELTIWRGRGLLKVTVPLYRCPLPWHFPEPWCPRSLCLIEARKPPRLIHRGNSDS